MEFMKGTYELRPSFNNLYRHEWVSKQGHWSIYMDMTTGPGGIAGVNWRLTLIRIKMVDGEVDWVDAVEPGLRINSTTVALLCAARLKMVLKTAPDVYSTKPIYPYYDLFLRHVEVMPGVELDYLPVRRTFYNG